MLWGCVLAEDVKKKYVKLHDIDDSVIVTDLMVILTLLTYIAEINEWSHDEIIETINEKFTKRYPNGAKGMEVR